MNYAREERGDDFVDNNLTTRIGDLEPDIIKGNFDVWELLSAKSGPELRDAIAEVAAGQGAKDKKNKKPWFKDQRIGRGLAPIVWAIVADAPGSPLALALAQTEAWLYA